MNYEHRYPLKIVTLYKVLYTAIRTSFMLVVWDPIKSTISCYHCFNTVS